MVHIDHASLGAMMDTQTYLQPIRQRIWKTTDELIELIEKYKTTPKAIKEKTEELKDIMEEIR